MKKRKSLFATILSTAAMLTALTVTNKTNACIITQPTPGVSFENSKSDLSEIHNRLVDEDIIGYNVYNLYTFYDYIDGKWQLDTEMLDSFNTYTDSLHGDYIIVSSLDGSTDDLKESAFKCLSKPISTNYNTLKNYSSFKEPLNQVKTLSNVFNNFSLDNDLIVGDVAAFGSLSNNKYSSDIFNASDSSSIATAKEVIKSIYIIEYVQRSYGTGYDNELTIQNDADVINEGVTFVANNTKLKKINDTTFELTNNSNYTYNQIKNMFYCYDGQGNKADIYRDYNAEYELKENGKKIYNELDIKIGTTYMCLMGYGYNDSSSTVTIKINTITDSILELMNENSNIVYTNQKVINSNDLLNLVCLDDGNCTSILAYTKNAGTYQVYNDDIITFTENLDGIIVVYSNFNGDVKPLRIVYDQDYIKDQQEEEPEEDKSHWYDWILKAVTKFINWLAGDDE